MAYSRPGGECGGDGGDRPVDLAHLARQTLGDRAIEQEVLAMFLRQAAQISERLGAAGEEERKRLAHGLVGSARGIGAFKVAECAAEIERGQAGADGLGRLARCLREARDFIASISR